MPSRAGTRNKPRERLDRLLEERFPDWAGVGAIGKLVERAQKAAEVVDANEDATAADHAMVHGLYARTAEFLVPKLRAQDISLTGPGGGDIQVTFKRADD